AEAIDEMPRRFHRNVAPGVHRAVNEGPPIDGVGHVALFFQLPQDRADGGILELALAGQPLAARLGGAIGMRPHVIQEELLQRSGRLTNSNVKHRSVSNHNTCDAAVNPLELASRIWPAVDYFRFGGFPDLEATPLANAVVRLGSGVISSVVRMELQTKTH